MGIQAQARDDRRDRAHGREQFEGCVGPIADDDQLALGLPTMDEADELARPESERLETLATALGTALGIPLGGR